MNLREEIGTSALEALQLHEVLKTILGWKHIVYELQKF